MDTDLFILAQQPDREPGWGSLIYLIIFFLIWIISAIVNVLNKRHQRRRAEMEEEWEPVELEEPVRREPLSVPPRMPERQPQRRVERRFEPPPVVVERRPPPPPRAEPAPPPLPRREMPQREMPRPQRQIRQAPPPRRDFPAAARARQPDRQFPSATSRTATTESQVSTDALRRTEIGTGEAPPPSARTTTVGAPDIARMLQPTTLQQNFILTEILQPPKGLRPPE